MCHMPYKEKTVQTHLCVRHTNRFNTYMHVSELWGGGGFRNKSVPSIPVCVYVCV